MEYPIFQIDVKGTMNVTTYTLHSTFWRFHPIKVKTNIVDKL